MQNVRKKNAKKNRYSFVYRGVCVGVYFANEGLVHGFHPITFFGCHEVNGTIHE